VSEVNELVDSSGNGLLQKNASLVTAADRERVKEIAAIYAVRMQEHAGLDRIFNGEQTRTEMYSFMAN
jgi:methionine synthase II (cobalamin-independent)